MITLRVVGALYFLLGVWCTWKPTTTAKSVGFELIGGHGRSEYITVYGGLEVGLGLAMIVTSLVPELQRGGLAFALILSAALPLFRIPTLLTNSVGRTTWTLAVIEVVLVAALAAAWFGQSPLSAGTE